MSHVVKNTLTVLVTLFVMGAMASVVYAGVGGPPQGQSASFAEYGCPSGSSGSLCIKNCSNGSALTASAASVNSTAATASDPSLTTCVSNCSKGTAELTSDPVSSNGSAAAANTDTASCKTVSRIPKGAPQTGGGSTSSGINYLMVALGGGLLLMAGITEAARRRFARGR